MQPIPAHDKIFTKANSDHEGQEVDDKTPPDYGLGGEEDKEDKGDLDEDGDLFEDEAPEQQIGCDSCEQGIGEDVAFRTCLEGPHCAGRCCSCIQ